MSSIVDNLLKESVSKHQNTSGDIEIYSDSFSKMAVFKFLPDRLKDAGADETSKYRKSCLANSQLFTDAHETANKSGKLPSELLELNKKLLEALKEVNENFSIWDLLPSKQQEKIHDLITKATTP